MFRYIELFKSVEAIPNLQPGFYVGMPRVLDWFSASLPSARLGAFDIGYSASPFFPLFFFSKARILVNKYGDFHCNIYAKNKSLPQEH